MSIHYGGISGLKKRLGFTMYFCYSPQRSSDTRIDYQFELSKQRILILYRSGSEITEGLEVNIMCVFARKIVKNT